ncbi:MAG TPA: alpha/beta hydrolase, partial [Polyangiales bacterium]
TLFGPAGNALEHTRLPISGKQLERLAGHGQAVRVALLVTRLARLPVGAGLMTWLRRARLIGARTSADDLREILDHVVHLDPRTLPLMTLSCQRHSAYDVLPRVTVPLLIMAGGQDPFMPLESVAMHMHEAAPGSELVVLETATHAALLDFPDEIGAHVEAFLARHRLTGEAC